MQDNGCSDGGGSDPQTVGMIKQNNPSNEQINKSPGFLFWDKNTEIEWLRDFLPQTSITGASICCVSHPPGEDWKTLAERSSPIILCHSFSTNTEWTCLEEFLTHCSGLPGKRVIVIVTDVKDSSSEKSVSKEWRKWKFSDFYLITLTCQEIDSMSTYISQGLSPERRMARKLNILKNILQTTAVWKKDKIGIFSRSDKREFFWLVKLLTSMHFNDWVLSATPYSIANYEVKKFRSNVSQCTFGILYHTKNSETINVTNVTSSLYDEELKHLHEKLGRDNVIVVIDDLEESTDQVKDQILKEQHSIKKWARDLFLFSQEEKNTDPRRPNVGTKMKQLETMITELNASKEQNTDTVKANPKRVHTVGIFSVTEDTEYNWLKSLLGKKFRSVRSFYISFSRFHQFQNDLSQCSHGILYHTKNRGRINVTDVADSLYDKHLENMSAKLGKSRVIVVIDDLDDNSDKMKRTILQEQPKIHKFAGDLFLVKKGTDQQKMCYFKHNRKPDFS
ncbi:uncharacterized protein [Aquarana catesbeiana]|uniref:uncharacterized protein n=1 Tax=Aquarana catesbeiana TaxID=8400 RepID=UPI003CC9A4FE